MLVHLNWKSISFRYINFVRDSVCEDVIIKDYDATLIEESNKVDLHGMRRTMGGGWWVGVKNSLSILQLEWQINQDSQTILDGDKFALTGNLLRFNLTFHLISFVFN